MDINCLKLFPKIELHCHLDGSLNKRAIEKILMKPEKEIEMLVRKMQVGEDEINLAQYLTCFEHILPFLQSALNLKIAAYELIREVATESVIYIEVRFAPMLHKAQGLSQKQAVKAVLEGLEMGQRDFGVKSRLLLCMMRGKPENLNKETLHCAKEMQGYGVAGIDLAGNEAAYPPELYRNLFDTAMEQQIPFTIHAGECGSARNVKTSILMGARRIGHGVAIADNEEIKKMCRNNGIILEMCPISNLQTGAVEMIGNYPLLKMQSEKVPVMINTDNRMVSNTTLVKEWALLDPEFHIIRSQNLKETGSWAIQASFLPWEEKDALQKEFDEKIRWIK